MERDADVAVPSDTAVAAESEVPPAPAAPPFFVGAVRRSILPVVVAIARRARLPDLQARHALVRAVRPRSS